jgi:hypothetical protein
MILVSIESRKAAQRPFLPAPTTTTSKVTYRMVAQIRGNEITCDVATLQSGIWFLHVKGAEQILTVKFIILR